MLSLEEKADSLGRGIFEMLDRETLAAMAGRMGERDLAGGEVLLIKGEPGDEIFVVVEGEIEIFVGAHIIAVLGAGQMFGEMAVLGGGRRTAGARAKGKTRLLFLKEKALKLLVQQIPDLAFAIFKVLIDRLEEANRLALFLSSAKKQLGYVEIIAGDIKGKRIPIFHAEAVVGKSKGSVTADALRVALPTADATVLEQHAFLKIEDGNIYLEPRNGTAQVHGMEIEDSLMLAPDDEVTLGGVTLTFHVGG
jgi:CRP-like cAMP-binding protein